MKDDAPPPPSDAPDPDPAPDGEDASAPVDRDYAITRLTREPHGKAGWQVALIRRGRLVQSSFHDRLYGGRDAALHVARAYRDAVIEVMPPMSRRDMRRIVRRNRSPGSGVTGVSFQGATDKRAACWVARIELPGEPGRRRRKQAAEPSAEGFVFGPDVCFIFAPCGYDEPDILRSGKASICLMSADGGHGGPVADLSGEDYALRPALDMLFVGF